MDTSVQSKAFSIEGLVPLKAVRIIPDARTAARFQEFKAQLDAVREYSARVEAGTAQPGRGPAVPRLDLPDAMGTQGQVHTVFRVNGEIVALHGEAGSTLVAPGVDAGASQQRIDAWESGLEGDELNDAITEQMAERLREVYGDSLTVEQYDPGEGPDMAGLKAEMYAKVRAENAQARIAANSETLEILNGVEDMADA